MTKKDPNDFLQDKETIDRLRRKAEAMRTGEAEEDYDALEGVVREGEIESLNRIHAFIKHHGNKPAIMTMIWNEVHKRRVPSFGSPDNLKAIYANKERPTVSTNKAGQKVVTYAEYWLKHGKRRTYHSVVFDPTLPPGENNQHCNKYGDMVDVWNLWEGFNCTMKKGDWRLIFRHIYIILCNRDPAKTKYVIKWIAWLFQNPDKLPEVAIVFKGKQGAGKGFIFEQLCHIFGVHALNISSQDHLSGKFNAHLRNICFLFADEAVNPGNVEAEGKIKELITQKTIATEPKFFDVALSVNRIHLGMSTNNDWVIPATEDTRRFFINEVDNRYAMGQASQEVKDAYFNPLWHQANNGGREAMLYDLYHMQLGSWHPRQDPPRTEEFRNQQLLSLRGHQRAMYEMLDIGVFPGRKRYGKPYVASMDELVALFTKQTPNTKIATRMLTNMFATLGIVKHRTSDGAYWDIPPLGELRRKWDVYFVHGDWNYDEEWIVKEITY